MSSSFVEARIGKGEGIGDGEGEKEEMLLVREEGLGLKEGEALGGC